MKAERTLKHQIARSFVLLAVALAGFFLLVSYVAVEIIEAQVLGGQLEKTADTLIGHHLKQQPIEPPSDVSFYINGDIPPELRGKAGGSHEMSINRRQVQVMLRVEGGNRYALVQDMDEFEHTEFIIYSALAAGFVSSILLAVVLGYGTARRVVAPLTVLASAVDAGQPSPLPSLDAQDEIGTLARALARRTEELQRFLERERLFTGDVSHELRTPLTIMLGAAEVLEVQLDGRPKQQEIARRLQRVAADTAQRVSALLWLSRAPERLDAPRVLVNPVIRHELDRCQPLLEGKPVVCHFEEDCQVQVRARPELLGIAIGNLVRNACQHTEHGQVLVRLRAGEIIIADTGPGMPEQVATRLFERFVHGTDATPYGSGLGLSIVKRVVEHLGWVIQFERPPGGGSRFVLRFPAVPVSSPPDVPAPHLG